MATPPIPTSLLASARSAYRTLFRASSVTFRDDYTTRDAFRTKMRNETLACPRTADVKDVEEKINLAKEIADVLLKNVVQAVKLGEPRGLSDHERFQLRFTEHTEIANNDTIKKSPPIESSRSARKRASSLDAAKSNDPAPQLPRYYNQLKKTSKNRVIPELKEEDLEESFVRGSGPGGQSINKTENNVQLLHKPTGIRASCQETRSLSQNRKLARRWLVEKLDALYNPGLSKQEIKRALQQERKRRRKKKGKRKHQSEHDDVDAEES